MRGLFGNQFDYDHDGELNAYERAEEYSFFEMLHEDDKKDDDDEYSRKRYLDDDDDEDEDEDDDY